jgi:hypothetical protein
MPFIIQVGSFLGLLTSRILPSCAKQIILRMLLLDSVDEKLQHFVVGRDEMALAALQVQSRHIGVTCRNSL